MGSEEQMSWGEGQGIEKKRSRPHNQQGPTVEHMELCSMWCGSLDGRGVRGEYTCVCDAGMDWGQQEKETTEDEMAG